MTKKTLKDFLEVYKPKSPDEQKFVDKHVTIKHKDRNGNGDDVFNGNTKYIKRKEERHGYDVGDDEKVYEEVEDLDELSQKMVRAYRDKARDDKESAEDEREYYKAHDDNTDDEDEKIRKRSAGIKMASKKIHGGAKVPVKEELEIEALLDEALDLLLSIDEKTLTPAEMKKREEVVKAIKRGNPKMDKSMAYAIATKTAKRVAESSDEYGKSIDTIKKKNITNSDKDKIARLHAMMSAEKKPVKEEIDKDLEDELKAQRQTKKSVGGKWKSVSYKTPDGRWATKDVKEEAEELDELSKKTLGAYGSKALRAGLSGDVKSEKRMKGANLASAKMYPDQYKKSPLRAKVPANEEIEIDEGMKEKIKGVIRREKAKDMPLIQNRRDYAAKKAGEAYEKGDEKKGRRYMDWREKSLKKEEVEDLEELSVKKLTDYTAAASDARRHRGMPTTKLDNRYKGVMRAGDKINKGFSKVHATEEVEDLEELSKKTLSSYAKKAVNQTFSKGVAGGMGLASSNKEDEASGHRQVNKAAKRMAGAQKAIGKLTKEDIINRTIEKYVPEEMKFTPEERLLKRLEGLSEGHIATLLGLFEALNNDNQIRMIETVETREGINELLDFALVNRGE